MVFKSDKQRKKVMATLSKNQPKSNIRPTILGRLRTGERAVQERLRKRFKPTSQELARQRGARLQREAESLKLERQRARQLELEANVEAERETIRTREREARRRLTEIDRARRERTATGRLVARGRELGAVGLRRLAQPAKAPRKRKRPRKQPEPQGFFGI